MIAPETLIETAGVLELNPPSRRMNDFTGVFGLENPAEALRRWGIEPVWHDDKVAFGGAPVWCDPAGGLVVAGELVLDNATELRRSLRLPGASAGELVIELYNRHGSAGLDRLLGMFALATWDGRSQQLTLWRDGVGARTLYYARKGDTWWFAARSRAVRRSPAVSGDISLLALRRYLTFSYVPSADTMWQDVRELRPGHSLELASGISRSYWEPTEQALPYNSLDDYACRLRPVLEEAIHDRLPPDGPVVGYLSGGLDSSLVTALAGRLSGKPVHTLAIHFGSEHPDELEFSKLVAEHCRTEHQVIEVLPGDIRGFLEETMAALDDPIGDPLTVPNFLMGRVAAGISRYVLNGEGGDPCFGGPKNVPMILSELYASPVSRETNYLRAYRKCYDDLPRLLMPEAQAELREMESDERMLTPYLGHPGMSYLLNRLMYANVRLKGADHILTKVNNLTTANGLIGRSPLFDRRIVEFSFATPRLLRYRAWTKKSCSSEQWPTSCRRRSSRGRKAGCACRSRAGFAMSFKVTRATSFSAARPGSDLLLTSASLRSGWGIKGPYRRARGRSYGRFCPWKYGCEPASEKVAKRMSRLGS